MNIKSLLGFRYFRNQREKTIYLFIKQTFGVKPVKIDIYVKALRHKSAARNIYNKPELSNERLEFLGDSILDVTVAEYLFRTYPESDEGKLTQMKSRLVSRSSLSSISSLLSIHEYIETDAQALQTRETLGGNALEALFGALYLDLGYEKTRNCIIDLLLKYSNLTEVQKIEVDFKSRLYEEAHKSKVELRFSTFQSNEQNGKRIFKSEVFIDEMVYGTGEGHSKKNAEQQASRRALVKLIVVKD